VSQDLDAKLRPPVPVASRENRAVTSDDIFAGIDDLPWAENEHCFGPASDTPRRLRELRSPSEAVRDEAIGELGQTIYHLGARFPATRLAVPFLVRLALCAWLRA